MGESGRCRRSRGLTSVVGVLLLVGVTVVVAGTAGVLTLSMTEDVVVGPQAAFETEFTHSDSWDRATPGDFANITLTASNRKIDVSALNFTVIGAQAGQGKRPRPPARFGTGGPNSVPSPIQDQLGERWRAGETVSLNATAFYDAPGGGPNQVNLRGATVVITYTPEGASESVVIYRERMPGDNNL